MPAIHAVAAVGVEGVLEVPEVALAEGVDKGPGPEAFAVREVAADEGAVDGLAAGGEDVVVVG